MKVRFCTNCGFELDDGINFCPICGTKRAEINVGAKGAAPVEAAAIEETAEKEQPKATKGKSKKTKAEAEAAAPVEAAAIEETAEKEQPKATKGKSKKTKAEAEGEAPVEAAAIEETAEKEQPKATKGKSTATKKKTTKKEVGEAKAEVEKKIEASDNGDIIVECEECGAEIVYTAEQQAADIKASGFADAPKFCKDCKIKRMKAKKNGASLEKREEEKPKAVAKPTKSTKTKKADNEDIVVECEECGAEIVYTAEQQAADIKASGFADAPKFCKDCKIKRMKAKKNGASLEKKEEEKPKAVAKPTKSTKTKKADNEDIIVECEECGAEIVYTAEQQAADIKASGFADAPKFCKDCKIKRMKAKKNGDAAEKKSLGKVPETEKKSIGKVPETEKKSLGKVPAAEKKSLGKVPAAEKKSIGKVPASQKTSSSKSPAEQKTSAPKTVGRAEKSGAKPVKVDVNRSRQIINKETGFQSTIESYYHIIVAADERIKTLRKEHHDEFIQLTAVAMALTERFQENEKAQKNHEGIIKDIIKLFGEMHIKRYPTRVSKSYDYYKLREIHQNMTNSGFFGVRESARRKATTIANEAINFHRESIAYLQQENEKTRGGMIQCQAKREHDDKKLANDVKNVVNDVKKKCSSTAFAEHNADLKKYYAELYGAKGSTTKPYGDEFFERSYVLLGKTRKRIADVDEELVKLLKKTKSEFMYVDDSDKDVIFLFPEIDYLKDNNSIYYFKQQVVEDKNKDMYGAAQQNLAENKPASNIEDVQGAVQSYIHQILQHSRYDDFEFVFCDPVSNGRSFGEIISLVNDDGYGVANNINCERNEISKALINLSDKIKGINRKITGYDSIYEYNKKEKNPLPTTIFVAFNFCDQYYEQDKIKPILDAANQCGITAFFVESNNHTNKVEDCRVALSAYKHTVFDFEKYSGEEFDFITPPYDLDAWTSDYNAKKKSGVTINTNYSDLEDKLPGYFSREATSGLHVPFAVDKRNDIVDFNFAIDLCYHAFVSGTTGIGKSVLLHSIITNIIRCYHPDDVELWLVDYKAVEFYDYVRFAPPHIKLIGLDRSWEFTKSFIDKIIEVAEERKKIILDSGLKNINKYKKKNGSKSIPHTVIVIDEAHVLSQQIQHEPEYKTKFENILSEYRAFGIHVIMSDQAFSNSMAGITEKGKNQIGVRLAMKNSTQEVKSTIEVDNDIMSGDDFKNMMNSLSVGDVIYRWNENTKVGDAILHLDKVKGLYIEPEREGICKQAKALAENEGYTDKEPWIIIGKERISMFDVKNPFEDDEVDFGNEKKFNIFLGAPSTLEPYHVITVKRRKSANFLVVSDNEDISDSVAYFAAANMVKTAKAKIFVIAAEDTLDSGFKKSLVKSFGKKVVFAEDMEGYNKALDEIKETDERVFILWYGLDEIIDEMEMLDPPPKENSRGRSSSFSLDFSDPFGTGKSAMDDLSEAFGSGGSKSSFDVDEEYYDRTEEITELLEKGSASFKFSMVVLQNAKEILKRRDIKMGFFEHKFVYNMSEARSVFETSCPIKIDSDLQESSIIYYDGADFSILRPYKIDKETIEYFGE